MQPNISNKVLKSEQDFFDREALAEEGGDIVIPDDQLERYRHARIRSDNINKDTLFAHLAPLEGKSVLEYGCGHGENAILLAACGAKVTAFDLSPQSIALAKRRAEAHGLADKIQFDVHAAGQTDYPSGSFDIVTGFAILHHIHFDLPMFYREIDRLLKPEGTAYFLEPVANSAFLRFTRKLVPVPTNATPDERQLRYEELDLLKECGFSRIEYLHFRLLSRFSRILGSWSDRPLRRIDFHIQNIFPFMKKYYGSVVVIARR